MLSVFLKRIIFASFSFSIDFSISFLFVKGRDAHIVSKSVLNIFFKLKICNKDIIITIFSDSLSSSSLDLVKHSFAKDQLWLSPEFSKALLKLLSR